MATAAQSPTAKTGAAGRRDQAETHPSGDARFALIDKALTRERYAQDHLIEILHMAQDVFGYLSPDLLLYLARQLRLPPSMVFGVASFYHLFSFEPPGDHTCTVCTGTACFVKGADEIVRTLEEAFEVAAGATTADRRFTLATARCLGSCGMAPVTVVDGLVRGHMDAAATLERVTEALSDAAPAPPAEPAADRLAVPPAVGRELAGEEG